MKRAPRACLALGVAVAGLLACGRSTRSSGADPAPGAARAVDAARPAGPVSSAEVRSALEKAAAYFAGREVRGDEGWLVVQAAVALGPEFETWATKRLAVAPDVRELPDAGLLDVATAEARFWQLRATPQSPLPPLPAPQAAGASLPRPAELTDADLAGIVRLMTRALACTRIPPSGRAALLADVRDPGKSYLLTHQLFALMLAHNQGCLDADAVDAPRRKLAEALWREQAADGPRVNDLALERMAALTYAQLYDWIAPSWIEAIVASQAGSGAWENGDLHVHPGATAPESHTVALGLYVLAGAWRVRFSEGSAPPRAPASD